MREHGQAVAFYMLVEAQPQASFGQHAAQRGLAHLQWITPQVVAIELDQVEGIEEDAAVRALMPDELERGHAVVVASHRFAIDDARARAQARQRLDDQREAVGEVVAGAAEKPHALTILAGNDAEAVVLNFVQPRPAGRQRIGFGREARRDEAARKGARMGKHAAAINRQRWPRLEGPASTTTAMGATAMARCVLVAGTLALLGLFLYIVATEKYEKRV